jgi:hypothetical protein
MRRLAQLAAVVAALWLAPPAVAATVLVASAARTTSSTAAVAAGDIATLRSAVFLLNVTAAGTDAGDTLDVYVQQSPDGGTTWDDFVHFTQVLGNGGAKKYIATWNGTAAAESEMKAPADAALAAGVLQGPMTTTWRVKWVIVDAGSNANQTFTFSVSVEGVRVR